MDWIYNLSLMVIGLVVVFLVLILLIGLVWVFGKIMSSAANRKENKKKAKAKQVTQAEEKAPKPAIPAPVVEDGISAEMVAAISAAVFMMTDSSSKRVAIRSIKRAKEARPAWGLAGITENTRPF